MQVKVSKWGNSMAFRLPQAIVETANLEEGTLLEVKLDQGNIVATPVKPITLDEILNGVTPENYGSLVDFGPPVGKEIW
jgi:antitoxin MazE